MNATALIHYNILMFLRINRLVCEMSELICHLYIVYSVQYGEVNNSCNTKNALFCNLGVKFLRGSYMLVLTILLFHKYEIIFTYTVLTKPCKILHY
jgi:hypothetical protein